MMQQQQVIQQNELDAAYIQAEQQNDIHQREQEAAQAANTTETTESAASTKVGEKTETDKQCDRLVKDKQVAFTTDI